MVRASREQVVAAIIGLNGENVPYTFAASANGAVGVWDYADAKWAGLLAAGSVDQGYKLVVDLHEDGTYSLTDHTSATTTGIGVGGLGFSHTVFRGKVRSRSFGSGAAPIASDHGQVGHTYGWRFDSAEMKNPVVAVLAHHGWTERKTGFWKSLFGGA